MEITSYEINGTTIYKTDNELYWRLVHDGRNILSLTESQDTIETIHTIFVARTEIECLDEIERLGLTFLEKPKIYENLVDSYLDNIHGDIDDIPDNNI